MSERYKKPTQLFELTPAQPVAEAKPEGRKQLQLNKQDNSGCGGPRL